MSNNACFCTFAKIGSTSLEGDQNKATGRYRSLCDIAKGPFPDLCFGTQVLKSEDGLFFVTGLLIAKPVTHYFKNTLTKWILQNVLPPHIIYRPGLIFARIPLNQVPSRLVKLSSWEGLDNCDGVQIFPLSELVSTPQEKRDISSDKRNKGIQTSVRLSPV